MNDIQQFEANEGNKQYVIAYSLKEQKRANDLKERELKHKEQWHLLILLGFIILLVLSLALYHKLDEMNVISRFYG